MQKYVARAQCGKECEACSQQQWKVREDIEKQTAKGLLAFCGGNFTYTVKGL